MKNTTLLILLGLVLISCSPKAEIKKDTSPDGFWKQSGYGRVVEIKGSLIKVYDYTTNTCVFSEEGLISDFGKILNYSSGTLMIQHGIDEWEFTRVDSLPGSCVSETLSPADPEYNFKVFWETFNEHYASFALKGVDWKEVYDKYKPGITSNTSDRELYSTFMEIIHLLQDGHVSLEVPEALESASNSNRSKYSKPDEFRIHHEIANIYTDSLRNYNAGMIRYGMVSKGTGYIQINSMLMLADYNLDPELELGDFFGRYWEIADTIPDEVQRQQETDGANAVMERIKNELQADAYIIDLRFNGGGKDGVALAIFNHFSNSEKVVFTKKARLGNGFTRKQEIKSVPSGTKFNGPVYLLTSHLTASATEVMVLASLTDPRFVRIGSATEGIFSSTLDKTLPNGWSLELSNEVYEDVKGNNYEHSGIPPDILLDYPSEKDSFLDRITDNIKLKKDDAIERALELEREKKN